MVVESVSKILGVMDVVEDKAKIIAEKVSGWDIKTRIRKVLPVRGNYG